MMKKKGELVIRNEPKSLGERFEDDFDAIYRHYMNPKAELSEKQKVQLSRWTWCREWFLEFEPNTKQEIVIALRRQFEISEKQAYTDVQNSMRFFASMEQVNKEMEKVMMVSRIKKRRKALDENGLLDPKAAGEATKADKLLAEILGFMEPDRAIPTPVVIEINPVFDPDRKSVV